MANLLDMLLGDQSNLFQLAGVGPQAPGQPSEGEGGSTPSRPSAPSAAPAQAPQEPRRQPTPREQGKAQLRGREAVTSQWKAQHINKSMPYYGDTPLPQEAQGPAKALTMINQDASDGIGLSDSEKKKIRSKALMEAGIAIMASAWSTVDRPSTLGDAIWAGFNVFMTSKTNSEDELRELKSTQRRASTLAEIMDVEESPSRDQALDMSRAFLAAGMPDEAEYMRKYASMMPEGEKAEEAKYELAEINGRQYWKTDSGFLYELQRDSNGNLVEAGKIPGKKTVPKLKYLEEEDENGNVWNVVRDEATGQTQRINIKRRPEEKTVKDDKVANAMERSVDEMEKMLAKNGGRPFNVTQQWLAGNDLTRFLASDDYVWFSSNAQNTLSLIILARSGKRASDAEVTRLEKVALPLPGESAVQAARKIGLLRAMILDYRDGDGSMVDPYLDENQDELDEIDEMFGGN